MSTEAMAASFISLDTLHLLILSILLLFIFLKYNSSKAHSLPPGPSPWPIIGNIPLIRNKPHRALAQLALAHGSLISLRLGTQPVVVASSPAAARAILKTHDRVLSGRHVPHVSGTKSPERNHLSLGWTVECTEQWKFLRALCKTELFGGKSLDSKTDLREKKIHEMVKFLGSKEGEAVKIREIVFASAFNLLGNVLVSRDFVELGEGEEGGMSGVIRKLMELCTAPNVSDLYPILGRLDLQGLRREADRYSKKLCGVWESIIRERSEGEEGDGKRKRDFLDVLLENGFSDDQINCLFLELFTAGTDTSTSTVEWAMAEMIKNQEAMSKIREELAREAPNSFIRESDLLHLHYLHACVKETLRLHPPAPLLLPRRATQKCQVMSYTIPKDTQIMVNVWAIGRDPKFWENPLCFKPERFLDSELDFKGNDFEFLPFGGGRRICPGLSNAIRQVHLTLASLIHHFEWSLPHNLVPDQLDMSEKFGVTLLKEEPLVLVPKRRT
ncbi:probable (S)-N-methylcoclaurine 3'-hydroxylase isozyme 2 [Malania oleifera]|uniref:probable (S)-N-methylcoclaurine 3'-hydroxylase isozyme 2 n=1 Tax=Malania oleifera TaxID=397392 RepID=UPI0025AE1DA2|nr:probable (S)-N-methylcoclaurine 3'-hydroxylase isozyme 2 [Malania oleifera]